MSTKFIPTISLITNINYVTRARVCAVGDAGEGKKRVKFGAGGAGRAERQAPARWTDGFFRDVFVASDTAGGVERDCCCPVVEVAYAIVVTFADGMTGRDTFGLAIIDFGGAAVGAVSVDVVSAAFGPASGVAVSRPVSDDTGGSTWYPARIRNGGWTGGGGARCPGLDSGIAIAEVCGVVIIGDVAANGVVEVLSHPNFAVGEFGDEVSVVITLINQAILFVGGHRIEHVGAVGSTEVAEVLHVIEIVNAHSAGDAWHSGEFQYEFVETSGLVGVGLGGEGNGGVGIGNRAGRVGHLVSGSKWNVSVLGEGSGGVGIYLDTPVVGGKGRFGVFTSGKGRDGRGVSRTISRGNRTATGEVRSGSGELEFVTTLIVGSDVDSKVFGLENRVRTGRGEVEFYEVGRNINIENRRDTDGKVKIFCVAVGRRNDNR